MSKNSGSAIVGTGFIGPVHLEALRRLGRPVVGILGSSAEKSQRMAQQLGLAKGYSSFDELLTDESVSTVHLTSPNRLHYSQSKQALESGKHVICEKPLAMTTEESRELVKLAANTDRVTAVCHNIRFYPLCQQAKAMIQRGDLGKIYHITGSYVQDWLLYDTDFNWRVLADEGGKLRAVADIGTHWMDLLTWITGLKIESVCADLATVMPMRQLPTGSQQTFTGSTPSPDEREAIAIDTEDYASILFHCQEGAKGSYTVSQVNAGRKNCLRFEIAGSKASLSWNSERPNELWIGHRDRANELMLRDPALLADEIQNGSDYPGGHNEGFPDTFKQLFRSVYAHIDGEQKEGHSYPTFAEGHREIVLCESILASHQQRGWVSCRVD